MAQINNNNIKLTSNPEYIAGLVQSDGSFHVKVQRKSGKSYLWLSPVFNITLKDYNIEVIKGIKEYLGVGHYRIDNRNIIRYDVNNINDLNNIIIPFFLKHKIMGDKYLSFLKFKIIVDIMMKKEHHNKNNIMKVGSNYNEVLISLINMAYNLNLLSANRVKKNQSELLRYLNEEERSIITSTISKYNKELLDKELLIYPNDKELNIDFIKGIFDGDGNITVYLEKNRVNNLRVRMYFNITQDIHNRSVLEAIIKYFNCGTIYETDINTLRYDVKSVKLIHDNILPLIGNLNISDNVDMPIFDNCVRLYRLWYINKICEFIKSNNKATITNIDDLIKILNWMYYLFDNTKLRLTKDQYVSEMLNKYNKYFK